MKEGNYVNCNFQAVMKHVRKAYNRKDDEKGASLYGKRPRYSLNHIIRERYPAFTDALNDLDDPLTLAFLYTRMPSRKCVKQGKYCIQFGRT